MSECIVGGAFGDIWFTLHPCFMECPPYVMLAHVTMSQCQAWSHIWRLFWGRYSFIHAFVVEFFLDGGYTLVLHLIACHIPWSSNLYGILDLHTCYAWRQYQPCVGLWKLDPYTLQLFIHLRMQCSPFWEVYCWRYVFLDFSTFSLLLFGGLCHFPPT